VLQMEEVHVLDFIYANIHNEDVCSCQINSKGIFSVSYFYLYFNNMIFHSPFDETQNKFLAKLWESYCHENYFTVLK